MRERGVERLIGPEFRPSNPTRRFAGFVAILLIGSVIIARVTRPHGHLSAQVLGEVSEDVLASLAGNSAAVPEAHLSLSSVSRRTFQMLQCSLGGRKGSILGLEQAGFRAVGESRRLDLAAADVIVPCHITPESMAQIDRRINGTRLVATLVGVLQPLCIGGPKTVQLQCRRELASKHGCVFETLGIQPPQFKLDDPADCNGLAASASSRDSSWLLKPSSGQKGAGIRYFKTTKALLSTVGNGDCSEATLNQRRGVLAQIYVTPALIDGFKFDVRAWMLVARVEPLMLFSNQGVVRIASEPYDAKDGSRMVHVTNAAGQEGTGSHIRWWPYVDEKLKAGAGGPFMQTRFRAQAERAMLYAAMAQFSRPMPPNLAQQARAHYQVFGCDFILDAQLNAHLLECNGNPTERGALSMWEEMMALLLNLNLEPERLVKGEQKSAVDPPPKVGFWRDGPRAKPNAAVSDLVPGYEFGSWRLFYNGAATSKPYNPCDKER